MVKTPEEYFADQCFEIPDVHRTPGGLSEAEQAFVQKYLGADALAGLPVLEPDAALSVAEAAHEAESQISLRDRLRNEARVQMVSFFVRGQLFLLPVTAIQEVLRYMPPVRLPLAPPFVAGVINLRGRVTPLLHLDALLTQERTYRYTTQSFIIIHSSEQMQLGLITDRIQSMHIVEQNKIIWNVEAQLGANADFLCAIADINDRVCGILAPEMIIQKMLAS